MLLLAGSLYAQPSPPPDRSLTLTATVTDPSGNYVMGLPAEAFTLISEKRTQPSHLNPTDEPMSIGILVDTSASMQEPGIREIASPKPLLAAVRHYLDLSNPNNEYFVMTFDKDTQMLVDWQKGKTLPDVGPPRDKHLTTLYDACFAALDKFKEAHYSKRAIVLFSDGLDGGSKTQFTEIRRRLEGTDVLLYVVAPTIHYMVSSDVKSLLRDAINRDIQKVLGEMVQITGGMAYFPETRGELGEAAERIAIEMRHQYRLTFPLATSALPAKKPRQIKLEVTAPPNALGKSMKLRLRTRRDLSAL